MIKNSLLILWKLVCSLYICKNKYEQLYLVGHLQVMDEPLASLYVKNGKKCLM